MTVIINYINLSNCTIKIQHFETWPTFKKINFDTYLTQNTLTNF